MTRQHAIRLAEQWSSGGVCSLREGEAKEYHAICLAALKEHSNCFQNGNSSWISVEEEKPVDFVSVLGFMTDAGEFPPVRECYRVGGAFFFPALRDIHPVSHWMPLPNPPKEVT